MFAQCELIAVNVYIQCVAADVLQDTLLFLGVDLCRPQIDCESAGAISGPDQLNCTRLVV